VPGAKGAQSWAIASRVSQCGVMFCMPWQDVAWAMDGATAVRSPVVVGFFFPLLSVAGEYRRPGMSHHNGATTDRSARVVPGVKRCEANGQARCDGPNLKPGALDESRALREPGSIKLPHQ
jgi:hypothetical protein